MDTICKNEPVVTLVNVSLEGHIGQWNTSAFLADTINNDFIELFWIPNEIGNCLDTVFKTIVVNELSVPEFDVPTSICISAEAFNFSNLS